MNSNNQTELENVFKQKLSDILTRKQDIEMSLNDLKKIQEDLLLNIKVDNIIFSNDYIQRIDSSTTNPSFNSITNTFTISRNNNNNGGSFPRFRFKSNNKIKGNIFKKLKVTFRWAGTSESYEYHNLANKTWCLGQGYGVTLCRTNTNSLPPKTGEYVTYIVNITNEAILKLDDIGWMSWAGPFMPNNLDYINNPAIWEFKEIFFISDTSKLNTLFNNIYISIKNKINLLNNDILSLKIYDDNNKNKISDQWNTLIKTSEELNNSYNSLLHDYNDYNSNLGFKDNSIALSKSKNLEYFGFICLILFTILIIIRIIINKEETGIENIILALMIIVFIYYIYKWYANTIGSSIKKNTPSILYSWVPESVSNIFNTLLSAINNKLLVFDYVR
jgi:hypothetical protein